jgi:hypothetical protein
MEQQAPPQFFSHTHVPRQKLLVICSIVLFALVVGAIGIALMYKKDTAPAQISQAAEETCSPPGTAVCGPDGKPVGGAISGGAGEAKTLTSVAGENIKLSGAGPEGLAIDPNTGYVYIGNNGNIVSGCEGDTSKLGPGAAPAPMKEGGNTLSIVDPASKKEIGRARTESAAIWTEIDTQRGVVYVAGSGSGKVAVHKLGSGEQIGTIQVGGRPHAFGLYGSTLIVSNTYDTTQTYMSVINADTRKVIANHKGPELPHGIAYDAKKKVFYMVGVKIGQVAVVDAATGNILSTFDGSKNQNGNSNMVAFSEKYRKLFISDAQQQSSVTVYDVDAGKIVGTIQFTKQSSPAWGMQVDDTNGLLYAALPNADAVGVADSSSLQPLGLVKTGVCPYAVRLDIKRGLGVTTNQVPATASVFKLSDVKTALGR